MLHSSGRFVSGAADGVFKNINIKKNSNDLYGLYHSNLIIAYNAEQLAQNLNGSD